MGQSRRSKPPPPMRRVVNREWRTRAQDAVLIAAALGAVALILRYGALIADSGPLPVPSRAEVQAVAARLDEKTRAEHDADAKLAAQIEANTARLQDVARQQKLFFEDILTTRLRNLQASLEVARSVYEKDPSVQNSRIVETLEMQLAALQIQIRNSAP